MRNQFFRFIYLSILIVSTLFPQNNTIKQRLIVTANICDLDEQSPFFDELKKLIQQKKEPTSLLINGDLIKGKFKKNDSLRIAKLVSLADELSRGQIIILSGDRDWRNSEAGGLKQVKEIENYLESFKSKKINFIIEKGCPGPEQVKLTDDLLLVLLNTQWWNHPYNKPGPQDGDCKISTTNIFKEELEDILDENSNKTILIAGHFPVFSLGEYGGEIPLKKHLFPLTDINSNFYLPLPVLGSFYASYRKNIGSSRDIINENFIEIHEILEKTISQHQGIIYLSGHDQNLQILQKDENYFINSGAPAHARYAAASADALLAAAENGIIELILYGDETIVSRVHMYSEKSGFQTGQTFELYNSQEKQANQSIESNAFNRIISTSGKMATTVAGEEYEAGSIKRFFWGDHYRDSWTKEISAPFLDLDTTFGGLKVHKRGGGRQTKSLKFKAANGQRYTFRSVNKDPAKALPYNLRETIAYDMVKDQISTQNPYGAMAADIMLNELGILHAHPKLYLMPDDQALNEFRPSFAHMLGMLEENPKSPKKNEEGFAAADKIFKSHQMFRQLYKSHNNKVNSLEFARARVFDILVGDWGKHEDNWKWAGYRANNDFWTFRPIPRDRDHVFSLWDGLIPYIADREWAKESGENFDYELTGIRSLMFQARHLDRFIASELSKDDWITAAEFVQQKITDEVIEKAVRNMPQEIYPLSGETIERKLKTRIKDLKTYAEEYYVMISDQVDVVGSANDEYFDVTRNSDGSIDVKMYPLDKDQVAKNRLLYSRKFYPQETEEIRLFGLDGRDIFSVKGKSEHSILVRLIGGPGRDSYDDQSLVTGSKKYTIIYENSKKAKIHLGEEAWQNESAAAQAYDYDRTGFAYDTYMPIPFISYNADDGVFLHLGYQIKTQSYGKSDFDKQQDFSLELASSGTFGLDYQLRLHHMFFGWDLATSLHWAQPGEVFNVYGIGNNTVNDDSQDEDYYKSRYNEKSFSIGLIKDFSKQSVFKIQLNYLDTEAQKNKDGYLDQNSAIFGDEQISILSALGNLDLDFRDNAKLPMSGMRLFGQFENGYLLNNGNNNYNKLLSFIEFFTTTERITPITLGIKAGMGGSHGKMPVYKLFSLGQEEFLRGFRKNRFLGKKITFFNSDLRFHLLHWHSSIVPIRIGMKGFFDSGKIIDEAFNKGKWHNSWGFGLYYVPLERDFTINTSFAFSDEESGLFTIGIGTAFK